MLTYVDSSAFVKLIISESESGALRLFLSGDTTLVVNRIGLIEVARAVRRAVPDGRVDPIDLGLRTSIRELDEAISKRASDLDSAGLRSLDAIHLATALELRPELDAFVTYDQRLADAARAHRLPVVSPA